MQSTSGTDVAVGRHNGSGQAPGRDEKISLRLRERVPAVKHGEARGWKFFDGPSGTQMVDGCLDAIRDYVVTGMANVGAVAPTGDETASILARARAEIQRLTRAEGYRVVFGQNMTSLAFAIAHPLARQRAKNGSSILISELEHAGNISPWIRNFGDHGVEPAWIPVDPDSLRLDMDAMHRELEARQVELVAVTLAANSVGTIPPVAEIVKAARAAGAAVAVDGVQAMFDQQVDLSELQPDVFFWSAYKFYGPHMGIALIREEFAEQLDSYKVAPAPNAGSLKFETGCQNHEGIAGLLGTIDTLAGLVDGVGGEGAREAVGELGRAQGRIAAWIESELRQLPKVHVYRGDPSEGEIAPTVAFRVAGRAPGECAAFLRKQGLFISHSDLYAIALARRVGVAEDGGWARVGIAGYNRWDEAEAFVDAMRELTGAR